MTGNASRACRRRTLLTAGAALFAAGCTQRRAEPVRPPDDPSSAFSRDVGELESRFGARLGVYAVATDTGQVVAHRADERFAFCSTFKTLAAAAVLEQHPPEVLGKLVTYSAAEVNSISPITKDHIGTGMSIRELCDAAVRYSDGTAGNLLMREAGGPAKLTDFFRRLGDGVSRMDQYEPELNDDQLSDPRDTTSPQALVGLYRSMVLGDVLRPDNRSLITDWLRRSTTGARSIRAGLPAGWTVADKTGNGNYGRVNDVAIAWPPGRGPLAIATLSDRDGFAAEQEYPLLAEAARKVVASLT